MSIFSRLLPSLASAYVLQTILALVFVPQANEKFFDLGGAFGFLSTTAVSLYCPSLELKLLGGEGGPLPVLRNLASRQLLLIAAVSVWSVRLGSFLVQRALKAGGDSRFDDVRHQPLKFTFLWIFQATWIFVVGLPVYLANAIPPTAHPPLNIRDYASLMLFGGSFLIEIVADLQKSAWRKAKDAKQHDEKFITSGLWGISRHPNYVGEVGIWTGIWALSTSALQTTYFPSGIVAVAAASPLFTWFLVRKVSGVPPLEEAGERKFGSDLNWQEYKRNVPVFWPWGGYE